MSSIKSLADNSVSTYPTDSNVNVYATGSTPMQVILSSGEEVTIAELNGGSPITTSPFDFTYNSSTFPSGVNPVVTDVGTDKTITFTFSGDIDSGDLPIICKYLGDTLIDNKISRATGTTLINVIPTVDGYICSPVSFDELIFDEDKDVDIVLTPVIVPALYSGYTLDNPETFNNGIVLNEVDGVYKSEGGSEFIGQGLEGMVVNGKRAIIYTEDTKNIVFGLGASGMDNLYDAPAISFEIDSMGFVIVVKNNVYVSDLSPQPSVGQGLLFKRMTVEDPSTELTTIRVGRTIDGENFLTGYQDVPLQYFRDTGRCAVYEMANNTSIELNHPQYKA